MKKIQFLSIMALVSIASLAGCGQSGEEQNTDVSKAQLSISTYEGGVGDQWLKNAAKIFEEKNAERTDFQDGKVGVQIHITSDRSAAGSLLNYSEFKKDIYFTENVDYYYLTNENKLADITDILTTANPEDNNKKIIDKIDGNLASFMNRDGKYYAIPFYDCFYGLIYDKDLFSQKSFYMTDEGTFTNKKEQFGTGPNGVKGDWDDGLPRTYEEFDAMMEKMVVSKVIPFTYSTGIATYYTSRALTSWWSDFEGYEDTNLNYNFSGTAHHIVSSVNNGVATSEEVEINYQNGYLLRKQEGLYQALHFARDILCDTSDNYRGYSSNYDVQDAFINNKYVGGSTKPIAMMFEGTWWENEAVESFDYAKSIGAESFNYGFMPIPKVDLDHLGSATYMNLNDSFGFISATCSNMKLAKEFMSFLHTDEQLRAFTIETNMTRGLDYDFNEADMDKITSYASDLISIKQSEYAKVVYPYSGIEFFVNNADTFSTKNWPWATKSYTDNPIIKFIDDKNVTAEAYFNDHASMVSKDEWLRIVNN